MNLIAVRRLALSLAGLLAVVTALVMAGVSAGAVREDTLRSYVHKMHDATGACSAVMIAPERAMTAKHCIGMESPKLTINGVDYPITEAYGNPVTDLAVLIVPGAPCPCAVVAAYPTQRDETVTAVGYPYGMLQVVTEGVVQGRIVTEGMEFLVSTARGAPGMSGGGLFNTQGELVGILSGMDPAGLISVSVELFTQNLGGK